MPTKQLETIYCKRLLPSITYCLSVWESCSLTLFDDIEKFHIKAARIIHNIPNNKYMDHQILSIVKWHNIAFMYKQPLGVQMFKVMKSNSTHRLSQNFEIVNSRNMFRFRREKTEFGRQSLLFRGPILWNRLNNETRGIDYVNIFKLLVSLEEMLS